MKFNKKNLKNIKGDASFRSFYRKRNNKKKTVIVYSSKEKEKNLLIYDAINKLLIRNKILAPKLFNENYNKNFIEIEDFGDITLFKLLKKRKQNQLKLLKDVIDLLKKIQKIKQSKIKNFKGNYYKIPKYSKKELFKEAKLFCNWYVTKFLTKTKASKLNSLLNEEIKFLLSKVKLKNNVFVHRDFHVSNLMKYKNKIAIIDSQDALIGNKAYDLASLIDDVRFQTSLEFKNKIFNYYQNLNKRNINNHYLKNDFEILSVLRNMKIIGIFTRLAKRDNKKDYLKLIPYAWKLIEIRTKKNNIFKKLKILLDINFPKKIRNYR